MEALGGLLPRGGGLFLPALFIHPREQQPQGQRAFPHEAGEQKDNRRQGRRDEAQLLLVK